MQMAISGLRTLAKQEAEKRSKEQQAPAGENT